MNKISLNQLDENFKDEDYILMIGLGFDQRCLSVLKNFPKNNTVQIIGISNAGWSEFNELNIVAFMEIAGNKAKIIGSGATFIMNVVDELSNYFSKNNPYLTQQLVIDVTSLSHELLVVILGMLSNLDALNRVTLLYVGASKYSINSSDSDAWLSRGVRMIRSVLGFPGIMYPSKKLHLIVMAGFEVERAAEVINQYEPSSLSIGVTDRHIGSIP